MKRLQFRGLSLAEIVIAIGVLGIFSTAVFSAVTNSYRLSERGVEMSEALYLSNTVIEDFQTRILGDGWDQYDSSTNGNLQIDPEKKEFCYRLTVQDLGSNARKAECRVFWQDTNQATPTIDTSRGTNGLLIRCTTLIYRD